MTWQPIVKPHSGWTVVPNLQDYEQHVPELDQNGLGRQQEALGGSPLRKSRAGQACACDRTVAF